LVLPEDRKRFKELTMGNAVIVGRKTLEDFPGGKPLKGRHNIVMTRKDVEIEDAMISKNVGAALVHSRHYDDCYVIGGASVFEQFFNFIDEVYVTKIHATPESDAYFPNLDKDWKWRCVESAGPMVCDGIKYEFCVYKRMVT